jgi:hypothetical protein
MAPSLVCSCLKVAQGETVLVSPCTLIQHGFRPPLAGCAPGVSNARGTIYSQSTNQPLWASILGTG